MPDQICERCGTTFIKLLCKTRDQKVAITRCPTCGRRYTEHREDPAAPEWGPVALAQMQVAREEEEKTGVLLKKGPESPTPWLFSMTDKERRAWHKAHDHYTQGPKHTTRT